jgi:hypothetical protein
MVSDFSLGKMENLIEQPWYTGSSLLPRVDHLDAATLKVHRIARRHAGAMRAGDGGNLGVELTDGSAGVTALFGNKGIGQS